MIRMIAIATFLVTAYCDASCSKKANDPAYGIMASRRETYWGAVACPPEMPFGTKVCLFGAGCFICEDRGGAIKGNRLDVWLPTCEEAMEWGVQEIMGVVIKGASDE